MPTEPSFMNNYSPGTTARSANKYGLRGQEFKYRLAKRASWALAYKKIYDQIKKEIAEKNYTPQGDFSEELKEVGVALNSSLEILTRICRQEFFPENTSAGNEHEREGQDADEYLKGIEASFGRLVRLAKDNNIFTSYGDKKVKSSDIQTLIHKIEREEIFHKYITTARKFNPVQMLRDLNQESSLFQQSEIQQSISTYAGLYGEESPSTPIAVVPNFMKRYAASAARSAETYGLKGQEFKYLLAKRASWVLAYKKIFDNYVSQISQIDNPSEELVHNIEIIKNSLQNSIGELTRVSKPSFRGDPGEIAGQQADNDLKIIEEKIPGFITQVQAMDIKYKTADGKEQNIKNVTDFAHELEKRIFQEQILSRAERIKFFKPQNLYANLLAANESFNEQVRSRESSVHSISSEEVSLSSSQEQGGIFIQLSNGKKSYFAPLLAEEIQENDQLIVSAAGLSQEASANSSQEEVSASSSPPREYEEIFLTNSQIDDLVQKDIQQLTSKHFKVGDNLAEKKETNKKFQSELKKLYGKLVEDVKNFVLSPEFQSMQDKKEASDDIIKKFFAQTLNPWAEENLGRKLTDFEKDAFKNGINNANKEFIKAIEREENKTAGDKAASCALAAVAFIANIVFVVTVIGPLYKAAKGKGWEAVVPNELMQCYDPTTKTRKKLFDKFDQQLLKTIRHENMGVPGTSLHTTGLMGYNIKKVKGYSPGKN